jgi:cyclic beta-1,2-glucan synthetase
MAGDIYSQAPHLGRGGWSWYTGAAAWLHRAAIESIFGLRLTSRELSFEPCLPSHWPRAELLLRRDGRQMRFVLMRDPARATEELAALPGSGRLLVGETLRWVDLPARSCFVLSM